MFKKILLITLAVILVFSAVGCSKQTDEESAQVSELVTDSDKDDFSPSDDEQDSQQKPQKEDKEPVKEDKPAENEPVKEDEPSEEEPSEDVKKPQNNDKEPVKDDEPAKEDSKAKYTVTFDYGFDNKKVEKETSDKIQALSPEREGYTFDGWYSGADKWDFETSVSQDITLTAKWSKNTYTITYDAKGVPERNPTSYSISEKDIHLDAPDTGFNLFSGWHITNGEKGIISNFIPAGMTGNLTLSPVCVKDKLVLGKYEQDGDISNGEEPIVFKKLKEENGKSLYISEYILEAVPFNTVNDSNCQWATSSLRNWCNAKFYSNVFTAEEKKIIIQSDIVTKDDYSGKSSKDFVFVLSEQEARETMPTTPSLQAKVTKQAEKNGATAGFNGNGWWWLRNKTGEQGIVTVEDQGYIRATRDTGYYMNLTSFGVRPAIWVDNSKIS